MKKKITYKNSGVDIEKANAFVKAIKGSMSQKLSKSVLERAGSFGALFQLNTKRYNNPVLVSSTDGVGTKLLIAQKNLINHTVGIDLVAMNVNDILCVGAAPLFFMDYIACGKLDPLTLKEVVQGIITGCREANCCLIGGETAEMPGMYKTDEYDLAGFTVGIVDKHKIIDGSNISKGDRLLGLPSSGLHSNGYSLVRKVFSLKEQTVLKKELLKPTKIYVKEVSAVIKKYPIKGIAHITGGAYYDKLTKLLPRGKCFVIDKKAWPVLEIFKKIQKKGKIDEAEMYRTFNMGLGMILVISKKEMKKIQTCLLKLNMKSYDIGEVILDNKNKILFTE